MNRVVITYLARFVGILLVILFFFRDWLQVKWFPGLQAESASFWLFAAGVTIYIGASIAYYILRKKELAQRRAEMEELEKKT
ncbi:MAG: hypothetical protein LBU89_10225 [Fibromonadaceae bacterium]|jgi:hypothetical protein|nr:hypothetical protein [Fibromonadaceae bacterium]